MKKRILHVAGVTTRWFTHGGVALLLLAIVVYVAARLWLPGLIWDKTRIEQALTQLSGQTVRIDRVQPHWDGIFPGIAASGIRVYAGKQEQPSISLDQVRVTMALIPLLNGKLGIHRLVAVRPHISLERLADNRYRISGFSPVRPQPENAGSDFVEWLFAQKELSIEDGTLRWLDHREPDAAPSFLLGVNLSLVNAGNRHRLKFNANFPAELCIHCAFEIDIEGNPLQGSDWGGRANIDAVGLDLDGLPYAIKSQVPSTLRGRFDLRLRTQWVKGRPRVAQGSIDAFDLVLPALLTRAPLPVDRLRGVLRWQGKAGAWRLDVDNVLLGLGGEPWSAGHLRVDHNPETTHARVRHVALDQLVGFSRHFAMSEQLRHYLEGLRPSGSVNDLAIRWDRRPDADSKFFLKSRLSDVAIQQFEKLPGIKGISGYLTLSQDSGDLHLATRRAEMDLPWVFHKPLAVRSLRGQVHWERKQDQWEISGQDVRLAGDASAQGNVLIRLPVDRSVSPFVRLRFDFNRANARHASKYFPINKMRPKLRNYLDQAIISGYGVKGHVIYEGETRRFPFVDGSGVFEVQADIRDAQFRYLQGWTPIQGGEVNLLFRGPLMLITAHSGRIDKLAVRELVVKRNNATDKTEPVTVTGRLVGPASSTLSVLRASPMANRSETWKRFLASGVEARGPSAINLSIRIPRGPAAKSKIAGEVRFLGDVVNIPVADFSFREVSGAVGFNQEGITQGRLAASFLGQPIGIKIRGTGQSGIPETEITAEGKTTARGLADHFGAGLAGFLSGEANWTARVNLFRGATDLQVSSDLSGFKTMLPAPYHRLALTSSEPVLETVESDSTSLRLRTRLGEDINGMLEFGSVDGRWQFMGGHVALGGGEIEIPAHDGLHVSLRGNVLQGDPWLNLFTDAGDGEIPVFIKQLSTDIEDLSARGRQLGSFSINMLRSAQGWQGQADGTMVSGKISYSREDGHSRYDMDLDRLRIPGKSEETVETKKVDPRALPTLAIKTKNLEVGDRNLGALDFWASHTDLGWRILQFSIEKPHLSIVASGSWYNIVGRDSIELDTQMQSDDMGSMLADLGVGDQISRGKLNLNMGLRWREDTARPGLANLDGNIELQINKGALLNVRQGATRLMGVFNFDALSKYATLDFDPMVRTGFDFNEIRGRIAIKNGNAYTDAFTIDGSSADVVARGRVGLVQEDLKMVADVYPDLRGGVALATGWLWGPATAAWILAAQEILKKEIAEGTKITYNISGKWDKPKVTRMIRAPKETPQDE